MTEKEAQEHINKVGEYRKAIVREEQLIQRATERIHELTRALNEELKKTQNELWK